MSNISYRRLDELLEKRPLPMKFGQVKLGLAKQKEDIREQREPITNAEEVDVAELEINEPKESKESNEPKEQAIEKAGIDVPQIDAAKPGFKIVDKRKTSMMDRLAVLKRIQNKAMGVVVEEMEDTMAEQAVAEQTIVMPAAAPSATVPVLTTKIVRPVKPRPAVTKAVDTSKLLIDEPEEEEEVEDRDTALARMIEEDARIAEEDARIAEEHARIAEEEASIAKEHARIAEQARIDVEKDLKEKERNLKLRTAMRRRAHLANAAGAEEPAAGAAEAEHARISADPRLVEAAAEHARISADPRLVEASIDLPAGWKAFISRQYNRVYYYKPSPDGIGEGTRVWEKPTTGGKRTKKRLRRKSISKQMKKKRTTTRRKMTTTRRK